MVAALQHLGGDLNDTIILATSNPFMGLFIGLLVTAICQSSSTTSSLVVALVASSSITVSAAVPIIIGANIGTTITSTIVSFAFISKRKEYKRALAAGTYHDFLNILTAVVVFPLELTKGWLSKSSEWIATQFVKPALEPVGNATNGVGFGIDSLVKILLDWIAYPTVWALVGLVLVFVSILAFRKISLRLLQGSDPEIFSRFFFKNRWKSFGWGMATTALIRSSTVTTSLVVPIVARKLTTLKKASPFIVGANIGTTVSAFIAVLLNADTIGALTIAIAHLLFNTLGGVFFLSIPWLRDIPLFFANGLGKLSYRFRLVGLIYLFIVFFLIPFCLIYISD